MIRGLNEGQMLSANDLKHLQRQQYAHDMRNHFDIISLHKNDRLKHYGLHFAKYVGRLAREAAEPKPVERTLVDTLLVVLSTANTLHQDLSNQASQMGGKHSQIDPLRVFADAAGRFADACEKIDHLEEFVPMAKAANWDVLRWVLTTAEERNIDLSGAATARRRELAARHFYIAD
jgi:hypothetical protein